MNITITPPAISGGDLLDAARSIGPRLQIHTARHDHEGTFVAEAYDVLRSSGYLAAPVPRELGGGGASVAQVAWAQHELARHCSSSALATSMHLHVVLTNAWRWRRGLPGAEPMLRRVVDEGVVVASTGGGDFTVPTGTARRAEDGWLVRGRKSFVSGSPAAQAVATWVIADDGEAIGFGAPLGADGLTMVETWDAPGMRGTASHDLVFDDVFVADAQVTGRRQPGAFSPVLAIVAAKALPVIAAVYLGTAQAARDSVVARTEDGEDPGVRRRIGLIDSHLMTAGWTLAGVLGELGEDPDPSPATLRTAAVGKRTVVELARAVGDLAMDALGGRVYRRGDPVERAWRDLRAGPFHPLDHELTLRLAGDVALGLDVTLRS